MNEEAPGRDFLDLPNSTSPASGEVLSEPKPSRRVLVVEDDFITAEVIVTALEARGCSVTAAFDGVQALNNPVWQVADLVVTDIDMPRMGGIYMMRTMRARRPHLPVVIVTGHAERIALEALRAEAPGPVLMLDKPVTGTQVADLVDACLSGAAGIDASCLPPANTTG
ncbi:MAG TPA: response regulator [Azospirillum sp.]|nr:response regulator [Azospirillum sp.]